MKKYQLVKKNKHFILKDLKSFFTTVCKLRMKKIKMMMQLGVLFVTPVYILSTNVLQTNEDIEILSEDENTSDDIYSVAQDILKKIETNSEENLQNEEIAPFITEEADEMDSISETEQYFQYYCDIFQLNKDLVYQKAQELTDNFTNIEWLENNNIQGTEVIKKARSYSSQELGILSFVRHISQIPGDFGYTTNDLTTDKTYQLDISYEEFTKQISSLVDCLDPNICQAIQYHETEYYSSSNFLNKNNVGGIKNQDGSFRTFNNPAEGIIELVFQLEYKYLEDKGIANMSSPEEQIQNIQPSYCPIPTIPEEGFQTIEEQQIYESQKALNETWLTSVTSLYYQLATQTEEIPNHK